MRLDQYLVQHYGITRNKAKSLIESGFVLVNEKGDQKPSSDISDERVQLLDVPELHWVSRSAGKLEGILSDIDISLVGKVGLDIGSSTGGFTQILLSRGVSSVVSVDVGTDQLHISLRSDPRVELHENTDIRTFHTCYTFDIIVGDVSFISLREIIPYISQFTNPDTDIFLLYKPQFEVGKENLRKTGVPKDEKMVKKYLDDFLLFLSESGYKILKVSPSKVVGEAGNQEYMIWMKIGSRG